MTLKRKAEDIILHEHIKRRVSEIKGDNNQWITLEQQSFTALEEGDFDTSFENARDSLNALDHSRAFIIDLIAIALANNSQFTSAYTLALTMIRYLPDLAIGYLRAVDILVQQGFHARVVEMCDEALENVQDEEDPDYEVFITRRQVSQARVNTRVDFLSALPAELANDIILNYYDTEFNLDCLNVSKTWRRLIISNAKIWREVDELSKELIPYFPFIGAHIKTMALSDLNKRASLMFTTAAASGLFPNVQKLVMIEDFSLDQEQILIIIAALGRTLTDLSLHVNNDQTISIANIFLACGKLERLAYRNHDGDIIYHKDISTEIPPLRTLQYLLLEGMFIHTPTLEAILTCTPNLDTLQVEFCEVDALGIISFFCPNLTNLGFNGLIPREKNIVTNTGDVGIRRLGLHQTNSMDAESTIQVLQRSQSTLEILALNFTVLEDITDPRWENLQHIRPYDLRIFTYSGVAMFTHLHVSNMLRSCYSMDTLRLDNVDNLDGTLFEQAMENMPHLRELFISNTETFNNEGMTLFFQHHGALEGTSSLRRVVLEQCNFINELTFEALSRISTLETLEIRDSRGLSRNTFLLNGRRQNAFPILQNLTFQLLNEVDDRVVRTFSQLPRMARICLDSLDRITGDNVEDVIDANPNLTMVNVVNCGRVGQRTIRRINQAIAQRNTVLDRLDLII